MDRTFPLASSMTTVFSSFWPRPTLKTRRHCLASLSKEDFSSRGKTWPDFPRNSFALSVTLRSSDGTIYLPLELSNEVIQAKYNKYALVSLHDPAEYWRT